MIQIAWILIQLARTVTSAALYQSVSIVIVHSSPNILRLRTQVSAVRIAQLVIRSFLRILDMGKKGVSGRSGYGTPH